jgi:hypothetical protein
LIYKENLTDKQSLELEKSLIENFKSKYKLTNLTDGGDGISGYRYTKNQKKKQSENFKNGLAKGDHPRRDKNIHTFININNDKFTGTRIEFATYSKMRSDYISRLVLKKAKSLNGWYIDGTDLERKDNYLDRFSFINKHTKEKVFLNSKEFRSRFDCSSRCFYIIKKGKTWKDWKIDN